MRRKVDEVARVGPGPDPTGSWEEVPLEGFT